MRKFFVTAAKIAVAVILFISLGFDCSAQAQKQADAGKVSGYKSWSAFPILMYDSDIGVGYGGKLRLVSFLGKKESLDLIVFNSSKGERWYVLSFSIPDFEIRQGKAYAVSLDIKAEYDKYMNYYFFGLGTVSQEKDRTLFTFEKKELQVRLGHGFSPSFILEGSWVFKSVKYFNVEEERPFADVLKDVGDQYSPYISFLIRYDTSDSQIHPKRGFRFIFQNDLAAKFIGNNSAEYIRFTLDFRKYFLLFGQKDILAFRFLAQKITGNKIPLYEMSVLGGGSEMNALRGFALNRFNDRGKLLCNIEYRFPLWKKVGGNLFVDTGLLWPTWTDIPFQETVAAAGWGLRYYLKNFVVRFDMGFCSEGMGIYFNFGHIF